MATYTIEKCSVCLTSVKLPTSDSIVKQTTILDHFWNYLYHKNVRESHLIGRKHEENIPHLSFAFTVGKQQDQFSQENKLVPLCELCSRELKELNKLCQELEAVKKAIDEKIEKIGGSGQSSNIMALGVNKLQVSMSGSVAGKESIAQALTFLESLCKETPEAPLGRGTPVATWDTKQTKLEDKRMETNNDRTLLETPILNLAETLLKTEPDLDASDSEGSFPENAPSEDSPQFVDSDGDEEPILDPLEDADVIFENAEAPATSKDPLAFDTGGDGTLLLSSSHPYPITSTTYHSTQNLPRPRNVMEGFRKPDGNVFMKGKLVKQEHASVVMRKQVPEKLFECEFCRKAFTAQDTLASHRRTHTGEKPYSCSQCSETFAFRNSLYRHRRRVHNL